MLELKLIETASIQVPPRQRTEASSTALRELIEDIQKPHGLLHPIVVYEVIVVSAYFDQTRHYNLVAGGRRLQAIKELRLATDAGIYYRFGEHTIPPDFIPATVLPANFSPEDLAEAELSENTARLNLSWQDVTRARAALHRIRKAQDPSWTLRESAAEAHTYPGQVSEAVVLADHLSNPVVASAPSLRKAKSYIYKQLQHEFLAELNNQERGVREVYTQLLEGDAFEHLPLLAENTFDCIVADPPYGVDITEDRGLGRLQHTYGDSQKESTNAYRLLFETGYRVAKPDAHIYTMCAITRWPELQDLAFNCGWLPWSLPLIWWKGSVGRAPQPLRGPKLTYEAILYATKGNKSVTGIYPDVIHCPLDHDMVHPVQKPVGLYIELLKRSCTFGDKVLDPFCGTGTIFPAASQLKLQATGIEKDLEMLKFARGRVGK